MSLCFVIGISFFLLPFTYCIQSTVHPGTSHSLKQCSWFTPPSVFSHPPPPTSSKTIPPSPKIPSEDYFSSYPPPHLCVSCTHILVSPAHSCVNVRVHVFQIMSLIQPLMLSHNIAGSYASCNFPFSPSDTSVGTYKPAKLCPPASLAHVKPFWILPTHGSV